jgi:16S rRNA C1402 (ribose-2'-O) methylase RsmI
MSPPASQCPIITCEDRGVAVHFSKTFNISATVVPDHDKHGRSQTEYHIRKNRGFLSRSSADLRIYHFIFLGFPRDEQRERMSILRRYATLDAPLFLMSLTTELERF